MCRQLAPLTAKCDLERAPCGRNSQFLVTAWRAAEFYFMIGKFDP
jgi:hypothetical protein